MNDDELIDHVLRETMAGEVPQLSAAFDAKVMAGVRGRRLTPVGRALMGAYTIGALATTVLAMQDVSVTLMVISTVVGAGVALGLSSYVRALTLRSA